MTTLSRKKARKLALKVITWVVAFLVFMGFMSGPKDPNADRERPMPD